MRRGKLIETIKSMGLTAAKEIGVLTIRAKDNSLIACVSEDSTYDMRLFERNVPLGSNIDIDLLANVLFEYIKTPIDERHFLTEKEKQKFIFKSILDLVDEVNEINNSTVDMYKTITLNLSLETIEEMRDWINE